MATRRAELSQSAVGLMIDQEEEIEFVEEEAVDAWSVSKLKTINSCGKAFYYRYRTDVMPVQTPYLAFGKAVHKVIELIHQANDWTELFAMDTWNNEWYSNTEDVDFTGYYKPKFVESGGVMLRRYIKKNKGVQVLELESAFQNTIGPFRTRGVVDQVRRIDGRLVGIDLKTAKYPPDPLILRADPQFSIYWKYLRDKYQESPLMALYHLESGKMLFTERDDNDVLQVEAMIAEGQRKIDLQMFERNIGHACKLCPYLNTCLSEYVEVNTGNINTLSRTSNK